MARILLVADDQQDRSLIQRELLREFPEIEVIAVSDAETLSKALEKGAFDLALTDYQLLWTDGLAVLRQLKGRFPDRPVIMLFVAGTEAIAIDAMKSGLDDYVVKAPKYVVRLLAGVRARLREQERVAAIEAIAAALAHEIGNPLTSISTSVQLLEREIRKQNLPPNAKIDSYFSGVMDEINRIGTLLQQMRLLIRPVTLNRELMDFKQLCDEVARLEASQYAAKGIHLEIEVGSSCHEIMVDRDKMKQVLLNLLNNAVEAMPEGGRITLKCYSAEDALLIELKDTGVGVPGDLKIFEPFTTTKTSGAGLGLAIVRQIILAHGGRIDYTSKPDAGTLFTVRLPLERRTNKSPA
ncbi:MAG TPA: ATP-binding protein [Candidatus Binatia bacterium]|nr:ATP-binding protein [Candidatus Binatia bacterium]